MSRNLAERAHDMPMLNFSIMGAMEQPDEDGNMVGWLEAGDFAKVRKGASVTLMKGEQEEQDKIPGLLSGSLLRQPLKDGSILGWDYDGRLGILETNLKKLNIFKDKTILDLGSNAGHFPIEYLRMGAREVVAVEGRPEFEEQWHEIKNKIYGIDPNKIEWITSDVRDSFPKRKYDILSCLGLVYHMADPWKMLRGLVIPAAKYLIIESQITTDKESGTLHDGPDDRTRSLKPEIVDFYTLEDIEIMIARSLPMYMLHRLDAYHWARLYSIVDLGEKHLPGGTVPTNESVKEFFYAKPKGRGLWLLQRDDEE